MLSSTLLIRARWQFRFCINVIYSNKTSGFNQCFFTSPTPTTTNPLSVPQTEGGGVPRMHATFRAEEGASRQITNTGMDLVSISRNIPGDSLLTNWGDVRRTALQDRDYEILDTDSIAMPVRCGRRNENPRWEPSDHQVLQDLWEAARKEGLVSPYFMQLLRVIFKNYDLVPFDCSYIALTIFTDSQLLLWDARWRRALTQLRNRYAGGPHAALTFAQSAGD